MISQATHTVRPKSKHIQRANSANNRDIDMESGLLDGGGNDGYTGIVV